MSKKAGPTKYNLAEFVERTANEGAIDIEAGGDTFRIPSPVLWPDELPRGLVAQAKAIMGEDRFDAFVAAGGSATIVDAIIKDAKGEEAGK